MSNVFRRQPAIANATQRWRLAIAVALLGAASLAWHLTRPVLIDLLARSSIGNERRGKLLNAILAKRFPDAPADRWSPYADKPGDPLVGSSCVPPPGVVCWINGHEVNARTGAAASNIHVADGILRYQGVICSNGLDYYDSADRDKDGAFEVPCSSWIDGVRTIAVIRLAEQMNEVAGLVIINDAVYPENARFYSIWQDQNGDAIPELLIRRITSRRGVVRFLEFGTPKTVGLLEWNRPGGVLVPRELPDDGSIMVWTPADGEPYRFPADALVDEVCEQLLPVPKGFGLSAQTQPASATASSPAGP